VVFGWTSVNLFLVQQVGFDGQACFLGPVCEIFSCPGKHFVLVAEEKRKRERGKATAVLGKRLQTRRTSR
jgi:hypothetical protein